VQRTCGNNAGVGSQQAACRQDLSLSLQAKEGTGVLQTRALRHSRGTSSCLFKQQAAASLVLVLQAAQLWAWRQ